MAKETIVCTICKRKFETYEKRKRKTCSIKCHGIYLSRLYTGQKRPGHSMKMKGRYIGRKLTKEQIIKRQTTRMRNNGYFMSDKTKQKISIANRINANQNDNYGMKNKKHTKSARFKISLTKKENPYRPTVAHRNKLSILKIGRAHV